MSTMPHLNDLSSHRLLLRGGHCVPPLGQHKCVVMARLCNVPVFTSGVNNDTKIPDVAKIGALISNDGGVIATESFSIIRELARLLPNMSGTCPRECAEVDEWLSICSQFLEPIIALIRCTDVEKLADTISKHNPSELNSPCEPTRISSAMVKIAIAKAQHDFVQFFRLKLEPRLDEYTYLVGERFTIVDVVVSSSIQELMKKKIFHDVVSESHSTLRWFKTCFHDPMFFQKT